MKGKESLRFESGYYFKLAGCWAWNVFLWNCFMLWYLFCCLAVEVKGKLSIFCSPRGSCFFSLRFLKFFRNQFCLPPSKILGIYLFIGLLLIPCLILPVWNLEAGIISISSAGRILQKRFSSGVWVHLYVRTQWLLDCWLSAYLINVTGCDDSICESIKATVSNLEACRQSSYYSVLWGNKDWY